MSKRRGRFWLWEVVQTARDAIGEFDAITTVCKSLASARRIRELYGGGVIYVRDKRRRYVRPRRAITTTTGVKKRP